MNILISAAFFSGFSILSLALFSIELGVFSAPKSTVALRGASVISTGMSLRAQQYVLLACDRSLSPPISQFQPNKDLLAMASGCDKIAKGVIKWMPTHGFAYLIAARAALLNQDPKNREKFLALSQSFSPYEGWLAERRFSLLAEQPGAQLNQPAAFVKSDIATLLATQSGAELLANHYIRRPQTRAVLSNVALQATAQNQTRFLNQLHQKQAKK